MHEALEWGSLIAWILMAGGGLVLLSLWIRRGGPRRHERGRRIRPPLIFGHFALAATGLVLWIVYLATDSGTLAWIAFALLAVVAALGWGCSRSGTSVARRSRQAGAAAPLAAFPPSSTSRSPS